MPVVAKDDAGRAVIVFVERHAKGLTVIDDWSSFGQRTTASGTRPSTTWRSRTGTSCPTSKAFDRPTTMGPIAQIIQAAVDVGIARAALADTITFVRAQTRPWIDCTAEHGYEDPLTIAQIGDLQIKVHAAEALLERSGTYIDRAIADTTEASVAAASIAVAEAKALAAEVAVLAGSKLFELAGTRSTLGEFNLDRHWRNARTHTLHDPARWKYYAVGNYALNGINPPRHPWI